MLTVLGSTVRDSYAELYCDVAASGTFVRLALVLAELMQRLLSCGSSLHSRLYHHIGQGSGMLLDRQVDWSVPLVLREQVDFDGPLCDAVGSVCTIPLG